ncbi:carboxylating nicotinate-nucleotide diphosphorylase [Candidatus Peregrinibacteria bacterium]|nr:carboxylating nicotinate-nucleotide diphosphorylase [Candidatus Peregrinibacteria bacterium]
MDRKPLREFTHRATNFLEIGNSSYKQWVFRYTFLELEKDLGTRGDITTNSLFHSSRVVKARVVARQAGVFAGEEEIRYFLIDADPNFRPSLKGRFDLNFLVHDSDRFETGDCLLEISADARDLLAVERTVLNLLTRMSGIATATHQIVSKVADFDVLITPTRKTLWGLLDKRAVVLGGGGTHRVGLFDAILVKDNHLDLLERNFDKVLGRVADAGVDSRFVEIEVENCDEVLACCEAFERHLGKDIRSVGVILMDNMSVEEISEALKSVKEKGFYDDILFEASGGINESNVVDYAKTGVDIISMGSLTNGVRGIDMGLDIEKVN